MTTATLDKTFRQALLADNDTATIVAMNATRRKLKSAGLDPHSITIMGAKPLDSMSAVRMIHAAEAATRAVEAKLADALRTIDHMRDKAADPYEEAFTEFLDRVAVEGPVSACVVWFPTDYNFGSMIDDALDREFIVEDEERTLSLTQTGADYLATRPRAWRIAQQRHRPVDHGVTITEWVRRKSYTPRQAQAEKVRIDIGVVDRKLTVAQAGKHKAWVTRRTSNI